MTTRTIVTSQPDVACDVCARRLLRGEHPDVFLAAGRRLTVCELCAPRAAHEGWLRERDTDGLTLPQARPRRGRSLIDRLRQVGRPAEEASQGRPARAETEGAGEEQTPYDLFSEQPAGEQAHAPHVEESPDAGANGDASGAAQSPAQAPAPDTPPYFEEALAVFNESEFPRRVAGVARSLGAPLVSVCSAEHLSSVVGIVVAWELCWYRYEVDLSVPEPSAQVLAQGTELSELSREERVANATALEKGLLALASH